MSPSTLAVSISAPLVSRILATSSLSAAAHAARKTHPSLNWILFSALNLERLGWLGSLAVSLSPQRFSCSARLNRALVERWSTWDREPFVLAGADYAVSVHRRL